MTSVIFAAFEPASAEIRRATGSLGSDLATIATVAAPCGSEISSPMDTPSFALTSLLADSIRLDGGVVLQWLHRRVGQELAEAGLLERITEFGDVLDLEEEQGRVGQGLLRVGGPDGGRQGRDGGQPEAAGQRETEGRPQRGTHQVKLPFLQLLPRARTGGQGGADHHSPGPSFGPGIPNRDQCKAPPGHAPGVCRLGQIDRSIVGRPTVLTANPRPAQPIRASKPPSGPAAAPAFSRRGGSR